MNPSRKFIAHSHKLSSAGVVLQYMLADVPGGHIRKGAFYRQNIIEQAFAWNGKIYKLEVVQGHF